MRVVAPCAPASTLDGETVTAHPPSCVTDTVRPATETVPERAGPVVAAMRNTTVPGPLPLLPAEMPIQSVRLALVHPQPAGAETATCRSPPDASTATLSLEMAKEQPVPSSICTVSPAMTTVPLRGGPLTGSTRNVTVPFPVPSPPETMAIHETFADAVQPHDAALARTEMATVPPAPSIDSRFDDTVNVHGCASWEISTRRSLTVMPALRRDAAAFAPTVNQIAPGLCPVAAVEIVTHEASLWTDHSHSRLAETVTVPAPPAAANTDRSTWAWTEHFTPVGEVIVVSDDDDEQAPAASAQNNAATACAESERARLVDIAGTCSYGSAVCLKSRGEAGDLQRRGTAPRPAGRTCLVPASARTCTGSCRRPP